MAMTATISLSPSTVQINQPIMATLTVSNSGASAVSILNIAPTAVQTGNSMATDETPFAAGQSIPGGSALPVSVPPSGNLVFNIPFIFFDPSVSTYSCSANISSSDGSFFSPTAATCTVNQIQFNDAAPGFPTNP